jgi:hypothetical protein
LLTNAFSKEDINDLSNLFEAYLHLLYKKTPNISINYNSFLCDAFIFLRSRKNTNFDAICFPPVNEESKRNNYTQNKRHLIINNNFLEKRKLWEEFIKCYSLAITLKSKPDSQLVPVYDVFKIKIENTKRL